MSEVMTPSAERALYHRDHAAWLAYSAPRLAAKLPGIPDKDLAFNWALLARPTQRAVWDHLDDAQRARLKAVRA